MCACVCKHQLMVTVYTTLNHLNVSIWHILQNFVTLPEASQFCRIWSSYSNEYRNYSLNYLILCSLENILDKSIASIFRVEGYWRSVWEREKQRVFWSVDEDIFSPELWICEGLCVITYNIFEIQFLTNCTMLQHSLIYSKKWFITWTT